MVELSRLTHAERREIMRRLLELEQDSELLSDCDRRADERFLILDAMEAEDGQSSAG
jgi:hypothetical protein